jgi:extracellular factor (EF) 3-hydroxypalmitic acid methyl ester biosynthesis protein
MDFLNVAHQYKAKLNDIQKSLDEAPEKWSVFQADMDAILDNVFSWCAEFERQCGKDEEKIYKMKHLFIEKCRDLIRLGRYSRHVIDKPFGYQGDFLIIDEIYKNNPSTVGIERCMDNYFLKADASIATRNRKEDFKKHLAAFVSRQAKRNIKILDLASGPCTDIVEFFDQTPAIPKDLTMICLDHDQHAIDYAKKKIISKDFQRQVQFLQKNAIKLALTKNIKSHMPEQYDLIFSTGLFDYLDEKISTRLIRNLKELLAPQGMLIISNYRDKWSNASRHFMEWGGDWELVYRTEDDFLGLFLAAGFPKKQLSLEYEPLKVMQYCFAQN